MTDVKEKVAAAIVRATAELEKALSDLDTLPAFDPAKSIEAAHVLNNFLTVISATIELLLFSLQAYPDPQIRIWLEGLQHATNLVTHTVGQLVSTSINAEVKLRFTEFDQSTLVHRGCEYYQRIANRKKIRINCESPADLPCAWTDGVAVAAVLDNLLSNAVKYSPKGSQIWVKVHAEPSHLVCAVRDEGPGLSDEDQSRLFQKGVRLSSVPTGGESTMGYGLAVAKELIDRLGGEIWCESKLGRGACFSFRLPAYQEELHGSDLL